MELSALERRRSIVFVAANGCATFVVGLAVWPVQLMGREACDHREGDRLGVAFAAPVEAGNLEACHSYTASS